MKHFTKIFCSASLRMFALTTFKGFALMLLFVALSNVAFGQFTITETFKSNKAGNVTLGGSAQLTSGVTDIPHKINDPIGQGWLRLTNAVPDQSGYAVVNERFNSKMGVLMDLEFVIWGGDGADGFSLFLFDGRYNPNLPEGDPFKFKIGGFGGSLGYANRIVRDLNEPGVTGGYVGVGVDEYGNYAISSEGKNGGINGAQDLMRNTISIRGPRTNNPLTSYEWLAGNSDLQTALGISGFTLDDRTFGRAERPAQKDHYRRIVLEIVPVTSGGVTRYKISARLKTDIDGDFKTIMEPIMIDDAPPALLGLGFAASTGSFVHIHEVRNIIITTPGGVRVTKSVDKANATIGDELTYTVNLYNQDIQALTNLKFSDILPAGFKPTNVTFNNKGKAGNTATGFTQTDLSNVTVGLEPYGDVSFTVKGVVTALPANGVLTNTAHFDANGQTVDNDQTNDYATVSTNIWVPKVKLTKRVTSTGPYTLGSKINYDIVAENTGNVVLKNIIITDPNATLLSSNTIAQLNPGASATVKAEHIVTQQDLDAGLVSNQATLTGTVPPESPKLPPVKSDDPVTPEPEDPTVTILPQNPVLTLTKTAAPGVYNKVGQVINYTLVLKNTGNVTIKDIVITDANADAGSVSPVNIASLIPGASVNIVAKHTVVQADLDLGYVVNVADADGKDPKGGNVHATSTDPTPFPNAPIVPDCLKCTITPTEQEPKINLVKKVTNQGTGEAGAFILNDKIEYTFTIRNTGNAALKNIVLSDPLLGNGDINIPGILAAGASTTHKAYYTITAADIVVGKVTNQALVKGTSPKGIIVTDKSGTEIDNDNPTITPLAIPPVAHDDAATTRQNKPVIIKVQQNDVAGSSSIVPDKNAIVTQPINGGTVVLNPDGTITYTPKTGFVGVDEFTYLVTDKNGLVSNPAVVKVTITETKPEAIDDQAETDFNKPVVIPILNNDKPDDSPLDKNTIEITEQPKNGSVVTNPDGTRTYLPNSGFTGTDTFKYRVKDENGNWTNIATVTIVVKGFFIPNVITPNGDGKNDRFVIVGLENYSNAEITIFNRWGNEVYRNNNYRNTWDGDSLNEGTYYYLIRLKKDNKLEVYKGWVLIKR